MLSALPHIRIRKQAIAITDIRIKYAQRNCVIASY